MTFMVVLYSDETLVMVPWGRRMEPAVRLLQTPGIEREGHSGEGMGHDREFAALAWISRPAFMRNPSKKFTMLRT